MPDAQPGRATTGEAAVRGLALGAAGHAVISCADAAVKFALPEIGVARAMPWRGAIGAAVVIAAGLCNLHRERLRRAAQRAAHAAAS